MNDIQHARDVLAKWRTGSKAPGKWSLGPEDSVGYVDIETQDGTIVSSWMDEPNNNAVHEGIATLIVGTAGNPDLLDAIDGVLAPLVTTPDYLIPLTIMPLAAAIIAADERMSA